MHIDYKLIKTLVLKDISGDISPSEAALLTEAVDNDAGARELAEKIRSNVDVNEVSEYLLTNDKNAFTQQVIEKIRQQKKRQILFRFISLSAAASIIIAATIWYFSLSYKNNTSNTTIASDMVPSADVRLHLPDGKQMSLDSSNQKLQMGNVTISTQSRTLSYVTGRNASAVEYAILIVPPGKDYNIRLKDGSEVHLNAATKLRFPLQFTGNSREVTIDGEAYLKVAHNSQPFVVHLPHAKIEVLGTEFNINTYDTGVEKISLVSGTLRVKTATDATLLKPGQEALSTAGEVAVRPFDTDEVLAWRRGMYYIDNATFIELSAVLSRWYGCTVVVDTKEAAMQRFTGVLYREKPVDMMLKSIQLTNTIRYSTDAKGIIHIK